MVICFDLPKIAQSGLSSLKGIYYSAQLFKVQQKEKTFKKSSDIVSGGFVYKKQLRDGE
ncbi:hypothetical protein EAQG_02433 [Escherichia coli TA464]|nr:hypothetical protein EAQG_02433 [Escherichia coli TA464]